jgi:hypothetical protein
MWCLMDDQNLEEQVFSATVGRAKRASASLRTRKRRCLIALLLIFMLVGVIDPFVKEGSRMELLLDLPVAGVILMWCLYDAAERSFPLSLLMRIVIFGFALVGVPIYLFRTRGLKGFISSGLAVLFFLTCLVVAVVAQVAVQACRVAR